MVADLLERIRVELAQRLALSRAAVDEYGRLERALAALDQEVVGSSKSAVALTGGKRRRKTPGRHVGAARAESNRERLIAAVGAGGSVTRDELRAVTGFSASAVAQGLRRLVDNGTLTKTERRDGSAAYSVAAPTTAPAVMTAALDSSAGDADADVARDSDVETPTVASPPTTEGAAATAGASGDAPASVELGDRDLSAPPVLKATQKTQRERGASNRSAAGAAKARGGLEEDGHAASSDGQSTDAGPRSPKAKRSTPRAKKPAAATRVGAKRSAAGSAKPAKSRSTRARATGTQAEAVGAQGKSAAIPAVGDEPDSPSGAAKTKPRPRSRPS